MKAISARREWFAKCPMGQYHYEGDENNERMIRQECPNGNVIYYEGDKDNERGKEASKLKNGDTCYYNNLKTRGSFCFHHITEILSVILRATQEKYKTRKDLEMDVWSTLRAIKATSIWSA